MPLFTWVVMDIIFVFFVSLAILKYLLNRDSKGLKLMIGGGLFLLIEMGISFLNWQNYGLMNIYNIINNSLFLIASILVILGCIKLIIEFFE
jgi:hypothetical protein